MFQHLIQADSSGATRRRVLLAEDNPSNQLVARGLPTRLGCAADVVANGEEALRLLEGGSYKVLSGWLPTP